MACLRLCITAALLFTPVRAIPLRAEQTADPPKRVSVAVLWLEDKTGDPNLAHWCYASGLWRSSLGKVKALQLLSTGAVDYAFRQAGRQPGAPIDPNLARRMGERIEAQRVLWGSYQYQDNRWCVEIRVTNVATGAASSALSAAASHWFDVRDRLVEPVLRELRITPTPQEQDRLAKRWTSSPQALDSYARLYWSQEQGRPIPQLETLSRQAIAADPNFAQAYANLATLLATQGSFGRAEDTARKALQLNPELSSAHAVLGWICFAQKQPDRAEAEFRWARQLDPDDADSLMWLAVACGLNGRRDEATGLLEIAVSLDRTNALIHAHLANAYAARKRQEEARHYLPDGIPGGNALVMIGDIYRSLGKWPEAIESYERTMTLVKGLGINPKTIQQVEQRIQGVKSILTPTFLQAPMPRQYTEEALEATLRDKLTESERRLAPNVCDLFSWGCWVAASRPVGLGDGRMRIGSTCGSAIPKAKGFEAATPKEGANPTKCSHTPPNPFLCTDAMRQWAKELTHGANTDLDKARALFGELSARPDMRGPLRSRAAREVFDAWKNPDLRLVCMDRAVLFVALARAVGVNAFFVHVTRLPDGTVMNHACAAVVLGDRILLVDPAQHRLGAPHQQYAILHDLKATAFRTCLRNEPSELTAGIARTAIAQINEEIGIETTPGTPTSERKPQ